MQSLAESQMLVPPSSQAFVRFMTRRAESIRHRIGYLDSRGWDIHAVWLLRDDLRRLRDAGRRLDPPADTATIDALEAEFDLALSQGAIPDAESAARIITLVAALAPGKASPALSAVSTAAETSYRECGRIEVPPAAYWRRWAGDAPPALPPETSPVVTAESDTGTDEELHANIDALIQQSAVSPTALETPAGSGFLEDVVEAPEGVVAPEPVPDIVQIPVAASNVAAAEPLDDFFSAADAHTKSDDFSWSAEPEESVSPSVEPEVPPVPTEAEAAVVPPESEESAPPQNAAPKSMAPAPTQPEEPLPDTPPQALRLFHLSGSDELAIELDQRLEQRGHEIELLFSPEELVEVLTALLPDVVLVDAMFVGDLDAIGDAVREARQRAKAPLRLIVLAPEDEPQVRQAARLASVDTLLFPPQTALNLIRRIENPKGPESEEEKVRVMVVEDDRAQALFAESILRNAGMEVKVVLDGLQVIGEMQNFQPELVLMDLHMPHCDGAALTAMIREREEFSGTPIVFLSGESDEDKHFEALSAGGDDFLTKPIRPRFLIASVTNRVRRWRALRARQRRSVEHARIDPSTGLAAQSLLLERLTQALSTAPGTRRGGLMHLHLADADVLRRQHGLTGTERLYEELARFVVSNLRPGMVACRWGDGSLVVFDPDAEADELHVDARRLSRRINEQEFDAGDAPVKVNVVAGTAAIDSSTNDPATVLERAMQSGMAKAAPASAQEPPAASAQDKPDTGRQQAVREALLHALDDEGLELAFQPIVALHGGEDAQYQALLRLRTPEGKVYTAADILPVARADKHLETIDHWVLNRAMDTIDARQQEQRAVRLFISQTIESLLDPEHGVWLSEEFRLRGLPGHALVVDIDSRSVGMHLDTVHNFCATLVPHGIQCCLSFYQGSPEQESLLQVLPVDLLKLDPALIAEANLSSAGRTRLTEVVDRAHERGILVIAPRVEDARSAATLWMTGVDFIQGNLVQIAGSGLEFDFSSAVL